MRSILLIRFCFGKCQRPSLCSQGSDRLGSHDPALFFIRHEFQYPIDDDSDDSESDDEENDVWDEDEVSSSSSYTRLNSRF